MKEIRMNRNFADISQFEFLQSEQHKRTNMGSMSVFNATFKIEDKKKAEANKRDIESWKKKFIEAEEFLKRTKSEPMQKKKDFEKKEALFKKKENALYYETHKKEMDTTFQEYRKAMVAFAKIKDDRSFNRSAIYHAIKEFKKWGVTATTDADLNGD
jgi:hypothetical protein